MSLLKRKRAVNGSGIHWARQSSVLFATQWSVI